MVRLYEEMPTYKSLSKSERRIVDKIWYSWAISKERIAEIFVTFEKNPGATEIAVAREAFSRPLMYKKEY